MRKKREVFVIGSKENPVKVTFKDFERISEYSNAADIVIYGNVIGKIGKVLKVNNSLYVIGDIRGAGVVVEEDFFCTGNIILGKNLKVKGGCYCSTSKFNANMFDISVGEAFITKAFFYGAKTNIMGDFETGGISYSGQINVGGNLSCSGNISNTRHVEIFGNYICKGEVKNVDRLVYHGAIL